MRAVNLLPPDLRNAAPAAAPRADQPRAEGIGAYVVLGALGLCVAMLAVYVLATNTVKQKQAELDQVAVEATFVATEAAKLKPYADFDAMANARVETVRGLAAARFDWEQALRDLSRAVPGNIKLTTLDGDMGLPGTTASGGDPLRGSIQAPAISLGGCAESQTAVARMLAHLRAVDGVTRVALSKSEKGSDAPGVALDSPCKGKNPPTFSAVVFFERSAALAAMAPATPDAATASTVPVPNAVNGAAPADAGAAGAPADPAAGNSTQATTTASTTPTGATP